jgi:uncharacterized protein YcbX
MADILFEIFRGLFSPTTTFLALFLVIPVFHEGTRRMMEAWIARLQLLITPGSADTSASSRVVSGLYIYPIKSVRACELDSVLIDDCGFERDRRFMLVVPNPVPLYGEFLKTDATHRFITQRQCPKLATVNATYISKDLLRLTCGNESMTLHVQYDAQNQPMYRARIWDDLVKVVDMGDQAATFFQAIIGTDESELSSIRLTKIVSERYADDKYVTPGARTILGMTPKVSLSDGFPILVACEASLDELNRRLKEKGKEPISMSRFRPNIVIRNTKPFEEDNWKVIQIGNTMLHLVKGCPRCKQSCTDQTTGQVFEEPVETLAQFRALGRNKEDVYFAQNAVAYGREIQKGAQVKIVTLGDPVWDKEDVKAG